jgi:uncharacterized RDD family membrane protein YckC
MFCPYCGVKYDGSLIKCPSCQKIIPSAEGQKAAAAASPQRQRPQRTATSSGTLQPEMLASVGDRMLALAFDRVAIGAILLMIASPFADRFPEIEQRLPSPVISILLGATSLFAIVFIYHFLFEAAFGTTLGKAVMGLHVQSVGDSSRFAGAATRNALRIVDALGLYLIGGLAASFTPWRQRVGDLLGGTVVLSLGVAKGARAAMMGLWIAVLAVCVVIASWLCPECAASLQQLR